MAKKITKKRMRQVEQAVKVLARYWSTYDQQRNYVEYSDEIILDDALYGIGLALWGNSFGDGYTETRKRIREFLAKRYPKET
jgi:hypothetical protein